MRRVASVLASVLAATMAAGCSLSGGSGGSTTTGQRTVTLVTHDSFVVPNELLDEFQRDSGVKIKVQQSGDAGELTNKLVLTKANPIGDVVFGIDSTFASRALGEGVFQSYRSPEADKGPQRYAIAGSEDKLAAVDVGDVCVNIDINWFAQRGVPEPKTLADLAGSRYRDLFVVQDPATSSPGLAFVLATIAKFGEQGWGDYWSKLKANGVKVTAGWEESYSQDFSGSGNGPRPIVVSYASSPSASIGEDGKPRTKALLDTCYRQVEYTGVLAGAKDAEGARKVMDFLLSPKFQASVPENMFVYPAREGVPLPSVWQQAAPLPQQPATLPAGQVATNRQRWVEQWRKLVVG